MKPRTFAITNLVGCIVLTIVLVMQWLGNSGLETQLTDSYRKVQEVSDDRDAKAARASSLEADVSQLKDSIESLNREVLSLQTDLDHKKEEAEHSKADADVALKGLDEWKAGVEQRDQVIADLQKNLALYKARLESAAASLSKVAAERKAAQKQ
ncbi:MAG: hypothetical protein JWO82_351 [Akkermansiaceae bacterium]|nr:hypothetical protein [Akkermansiaceae bacterium]